MKNIIYLNDWVFSGFSLNSALQKNASGPHLIPVCNFLITPVG